MYNYGNLVKNNIRRWKYMKKINQYINKRKVLEFLDRKGFYIVLLLCISIITLTAYTVTKRDLASFNNNLPFEELPKHVVKQDERLNVKSSPVSSGTNKKEDNKKEDSKKVATKPVENKELKTKVDLNVNKTEQKTQTQVAQKEKQQIQPMQLPILGETTQDFAQNYLVYSKTLEQWTTHEGLDISAQLGTQVKAALDGTVEELYIDSKYGATIVINHGNGYKSKYSNLLNINQVKLGSKIKKGQEIGKVGNTSMFESGDKSHLHFEVIKDGVEVNPKNYIK